MISDVTAPPGGGITPGVSAKSPEGGSTTMAGEDIDTGAIEATGTTPATVEDTESPAVGSEDLDTASVAEVGGTALGDTVGDLLTSDSDGSDGEDEDKPVPEDAILDEKMAEDMAYAEKGNQDALRDKSENRTPEDIESLERSSSMAAETAMNNYIEAKKKMDPAEAVLREIAEEMKLFDHAGGLSAEDFAGVFPNLGIASNPEEALEIANDSAILIGRLVDEGIAAALGDEELSNDDRLGRIRNLQQISRKATGLLKDRTVDSSVVAASHNLKDAWPADEYVNYLKGIAVQTITCGMRQATLDAFAEISAITEQPITELVDPLLHEISRGRNRWEKRYGSGQVVDPMESVGYVWSNTKGVYVRIAE